MQERDKEHQYGKTGKASTHKLYELVNEGVHNSIQANQTTDLLHSKGLDPIYLKGRRSNGSVVGVQKDPTKIVNSPICAVKFIRGRFNAGRTPGLGSIILFLSDCQLE